MTAILGLITAILPTLLKIVGIMLDKEVQKGKLKEENKQLFNAFMTSYEKSSRDSARLRQSAQDQRAELEGNNGQQ